MGKQIDIDALLTPIEGENPAGEDLRYTAVYDEIKEARREEEADEFTGSKGKNADWNKVIDLTVDALEKKSKDLQIAAWLAEALINRQGFVGILAGLNIMTGLLRNFWEHVYPAAEDGDLDYRMGPLEFMNEKLSVSIRQSPITDPGPTPGYSWFQWDESRKVGYERDLLNSFGDVDQSKKEQRDELISEGKLTAEDFDSATQQSSEMFCESLAESLKKCSEEFKTFDGTVDDKFGTDAPRLAELRTAIEDCEQLIHQLYKDTVGSESQGDAAGEEESGADGDMDLSGTPEFSGQFAAGKFSEGGGMEKAAWEDALKMLKSGGIHSALRYLYEASCSMPSVRDRNRYRLLMAKLCLQANRPDLARPIIEQLNTLLEELNLERWESPMWIAEVLETLYKCLTTGSPDDSDLQRAEELFKKICTTDVTKAMTFRV